MHWIGAIRVGSWSSMTGALTQKEASAMNVYRLTMEWGHSERETFARKHPRETIFASTLDRWAWISSLWNCEKIHFYCVNHFVIAAPRNQFNNLAHIPTQASVIALRNIEYDIN